VVLPPPETCRPALTITPSHGPSTALNLTVTQALLGSKSRTALLTRNSADIENYVDFNRQKNIPLTSSLFTHFRIFIESRYIAIVAGTALKILERG
jgi:hypothetical protein